ncbi:MAG TPA: Stk1 family PASTA domain-containing Ser/Thr kinase [Lachnospiraceae bacterium]|nr:Stk1 family PASTA domain-containing Ser/Thr kinase [Lachnospiraceae bacterium]
MLETGVNIGQRYEIIDRIGSGGMADVYKAMDSKLNRLVAVKVLRQEFRIDKTFVSKFQKEAQAAAGLSHPNIVNVFDVGEDVNANFIVMELVEGITLKDYITRKKRLSVKEATSIAIQVSLGLEAAHQSGIVHRDVKPQNIMISTDGKVKLSDFGIARAASSNTISSNVMGSVHYSSPEQVRGGFANAQSDIYSLGVTLYEMLTGRVPFEGDTTVAIAIKHLQEEIVPPSKYAPNLPHSLEQIILKCTQKSVDRRYATMGQVIMDLKRSLVDPDGDFVTIAPLSSHAQTIMLSQSEMEDIRNGAAAGRNQEPEEHYESRSRRYEEPEEEDEEEDDEDQDGISGALEKAVTIGGFIIGGIIIILLGVFIAHAMGLFGGESHSSSREESSLLSSGSTFSSASEAEGQVEVPNIVGHTVDEAQRMLNDLQLGIVKGGEEASDTYPEGQIISQDIPKGTRVDIHTAISYVISTGKADIVVPYVVNSSQTKAETTLKSMGLDTTVTQEYSSEVKIGRVIRTSPKAGTEVSSGTTVEVVVSLGEEDTQVEVPGVLGVSEATAKKTLTNLGLKVTVDTGTSSKYKEGEVMAQSISEGTRVDTGTEITITVNSGQEEEEEPSSSSSSETPSDDGSDDGEGAAGSGIWSCSERLNAPGNYGNGPIRLTLSQVVDGDTKETTVLESDTPSFPLKFETTGEPGVSVGTVYLYELVDGEYVKRAKYTVPFSEQ